MSSSRRNPSYIMSSHQICFSVKQRKKTERVHTRLKLTKLYWTEKQRFNLLGPRANDQRDKVYVSTKLITLFGHGQLSKRKIYNTCYMTSRLILQVLYIYFFFNQPTVMSAGCNPLLFFFDLVSCTRSKYRTGCAHNYLSASICFQHPILDLRWWHYCRMMVQHYWSVFLRRVQVMRSKKFLVSC